MSKNMSQPPIHSVVESNLNRQIAARTSHQAAYNTRYGVGMTIQENYKQSVIKKNQNWQNSYSRLLIMQAATVGSAEAQLLDFRKTIKESKYYRHEVKNAVNRLNYQFLEDWSQGFLKREYKNNQSIVLDIMDKSTEALQADCTKLFWCVKQEMDNDNLPDSAIKARAYMCALLVDFACICHDAHMAIGPFTLNYSETDKREAQMRDVINKLRNGMTLEQVKTPNYDYDYACAMNNARPTLLRMQTFSIKQGVCGKWTHNEVGHVSSCITAIRNKVTDFNWLDRMSLDGLKENGEFAEEIKLLSQFDVFAKGEVEMTIDLLEATMWYRNGKTDEEIEKALYAAYDHMDIGAPRVNRVMGIIRLLRLCAEHEDGVEYFNELNKIWVEHGREAAEQFHVKKEAVRKKMQSRPNPENPSKKKKEKVYTEEDVTMALLATKFGKVTKQKEKKQPSKPNPVKRDKVEAKKQSKEQESPTDIKLEIQPPTKKRTNNHWSDEEEAYLMQEVEKGVPYKTIGMMLHRTDKACYQRQLLIKKRPIPINPELGLESKK